MEETITSPDIVFPSAIGILDVEFWYSLEDSISLKDTLSFKVFATSIPITDFPGIGASILISDDARAKDKSSARFTILLTLTPKSGCSSKHVTVGPLFILTTLALTEKLFKVVSIFFARCFRVFSDSVSFNLLSFKRLRDGIW